MTSHPDDPIQEKEDTTPPKSLLIYKGTKKPFEEYLKDKHSEDYHGTDDDMPDNFDNWVGNLDCDSLIDYGDEFAKQLLAHIKSND